MRIVWSQGADFTSVTSYVVSNTRAEAAPSGNDAPIEDFAVDAAGPHGDICQLLSRTVTFQETTRMWKIKCQNKHKKFGLFDACLW